MHENVKYDFCMSYKSFIGLVPYKEQYTVVLCSECAWTDHIMNRNLLCQVADTDLSSVVVI